MKRITKMKRRTKGLLIFILIVVILVGGRLVAGLLLQDAPRVLTPEEEVLRTHALQLHRDAILIDGHNDVLTWITDYEYDLGMDGDEPNDSRLWLYYAPFPWPIPVPEPENIRADIDFARVQEGGLDAQFFSIWVDCSYNDPAVPGQARQRALDEIEALQEQVRRHPDDIEIAYTAQDVERIASNGKLAALMAIEGGHAIEDNLENLRHFYELGVRYMTLTHNCSHSWADSSTDSPVSNGLSEFGREVVQEMNRLGMMVDVSHISDETFWDVLEVTNAPVIASHSSVRAIADHPRNMTDDMLRAVTTNGGVVMINFNNVFLDDRQTAYWKIQSGWHWFSNPRDHETPLSLLIDHIDYAVRVAGIEHIGLGSDLDGIPFLPKGMQDVGDFPNITVELVRRGYSDDDIRKILGGNVLRVLADVERVATQLSKDKPLQTEADFIGFITDIHPVGKEDTLGQILVEPHAD